MYLDYLFCCLIFVVFFYYFLLCNVSLFKGDQPFGRRVEEEGVMMGVFCNKNVHLLVEIFL